MHTIAKRRVKWKTAFLATVIMCSACHRNENDVTIGPDGLLLGSADALPKPLYVGIGEPIPSLITYNPYLEKLAGGNAQLSLSLQLFINLDVHYDDGKVKLDIGCANATNLEADEPLGGVWFASFHLCEPAIDDWHQATLRAEKIASSFQEKNPEFQDLAGLIKDAAASSYTKDGLPSDEAAFISTPSVLKLGRISDSLVMLAQRGRFPLRGTEANALYEKYANQYPDQADWDASPAQMMLYAALTNQKVYISIHIIKSAYWGGENLTPKEKRTMKYEVMISFEMVKSLRKLCTFNMNPQICSKSL